MASKSPKKPTKAGVPKPGKLPKKALTGAAGMPVPQAQANGGGYPQGPRWESVTQGNGRQILYMGANVDARREMSSRDRNIMVKKCRHAERNYGMYNQILNDMVLYTSGDGIKPQSHASTPEAARAYEEYFAEKGKRIDVTNRLSFYQCQGIIVRALIRDGDVFAAKVRNARDEARIQIIEAHRVGDPADRDRPERVWDGVEFGDFGEVVAYWVYRSNGSSRQVLANSMMHVVDFTSASAARGTPLLQHSVSSLQDIDEILQAETRAVKDQSEVTRVLNKAGGNITDDMASELGGGDRCYSGIVEQAGGKLLVLEPNEKLEMQESKRPNQTFQGFITELQRDVAFGSLPFEFVANPQALGGASIRLVTAKAARVFGKYQTILIDRFCQPTWDFIIADGIAKGEIPDDPKWYETSWTTPKSVTVDGGRDAANDRNDVEMGLLSMSELYAQRGLDFRQEMEKRAQDMNYIVNLAKQQGLPVWMLYKPGFNWLQQGQAPAQTPEGVADNLDLPTPQPSNP
jgi:lambda family phage portal protein